MALVTFRDSTGAALGTAEASVVRGFARGDFDREAARAPYSTTWRAAGSGVKRPTKLELAFVLRGLPDTVDADTVRSWARRAEYVDIDIGPGEPYVTHRVALERVRIGGGPGTYRLRLVFSTLWWRYASRAVTDSSVVLITDAGEDIMLDVSVEA